MKRIVIPAAMAGAVLLIAACADDATPPTETADAATDSPSSLPPTDGAAADAPDAGLDASVDGAPRTCSDAGFCHAPLPGPEILRGVWGDGAGNVWAVSDTGDILRFDGTAWKVHAANPDDSYLAIWGTSATDIWIGGTNGLRHGTGSSPDTLTFAPVTTPGDASVPITAIWGRSATDLWAVGGATRTTFPSGSRGRVVHLVNGTWAVAGPTDVTNVAWKSVWGSAGSGVWLGGFSGAGTITSGALYRKTATGTTFTDVTPDLPQDMVGTIPTNPSRVDVGLTTGDLSVMVLGASTTGGGLGRKNIDDDWRGTSTTGATFTWTVDPPPPFPANAPPSEFVLTGGWVRSATDIWAVGLYGRFRHWDGAAWTQASITLDNVPEISNLYGIWGSAANDLWVVGDNLAIHKAP